MRVPAVSAQDRDPSPRLIRLLRCIDGAPLDPRGAPFVWPRDLSGTRISSRSTQGETLNKTETQKRAAAFRAAEWIQDDTVVGLGTGSTVRHLLDAIAARLRQGTLHGIVGVPTSEDTMRRSEALGIPLGDLASHPKIDIAIDGADEVTPGLDLIKGLGGALLREKLVAIDAAQFIILVDQSKQVRRLGEKAPLPVEVDPFGIGIQVPFLEALGCEPTIRAGADGAPFRTDGGNLILDCRFPDGIPDPEGLAMELDRRPGILEHGLFLKMTDRVVAAGAEGIEILERGYAP